MSSGWSLVVHGGSGVIDRADLKPEQDVFAEPPPVRKISRSPSRS